jgi:hypothetical protein
MPKPETQSNVSPPPPPGYALDDSGASVQSGAGAVPPPPPGYTLNKPLSFPRAVGKTALKVGVASVRPDFLAPQTNSHPEWGEYEWGVVDQLSHPERYPMSEPTGVVGWLSRHLPGPKFRGDFTPRTPDEQAKYNRVAAELNAPDPSFSQTMVNNFQHIVPIDMDRSHWEQDPTEAASSSIANLIMLRQGLKQLPGRVPIASRAADTVGSAVERSAPTIGKGAKQVSTFGGLGEFFHTHNPVALAGPIVAPLVEKATTSAASRFGNYLRRTAVDPEWETPLTPAQRRAYENALENAKAVPADSGQVPPRPAELSAAPYRLRGEQIPDAKTVTPRRILGPERQLQAAPEDRGVEPVPLPRPPGLDANSPKAAQTQVLRKLGVASPAATVKPMTRVPSADITPRPDLTFRGSRTGEDAAMNQLTENYSPDRLGINDLRGIAMQRGIRVAPGDTHADLIGRIHDSLTPEEIDRFDQARTERMQPDYSLPSPDFQLPRPAALSAPEQPVVPAGDATPRVPRSDEDLERLLMESLRRRSR